MPRQFLLAEAREDIVETFRWYELRGTGLGHEFLRALRVALTAIDRAPEQFPFAIDDIRRVGLRRFPYYVYYVVRPATASVIPVLHTRRDPQGWQARR